MATDFWKQRLARIGEQFAHCEAVEMAMIRDAKPVSGASHEAYLADLLNDAAYSAKSRGKLHIKGEMREECLAFGRCDPKIGSVSFYVPSFLTMPFSDANRITQKLGEMFDAAGGALEVVPANVQSQLSPLAITFESRKLRWAGCLFDMALRRLPGMTHAEMTYLQGQPRPGCWSATLENVMGTSVELIDWLIAADGTPAVDDSAVVAAKTLRNAQVTVSIDVDTIQAAIRTPKGEETIDLPSKQVARWLKVLCERPRQWIPASDLVTFDTELDGARTNILSRSLRNRCPELAKLIETDNHRGARFNPDLASKRNRAPRRATKC